VDGGSGAVSDANGSGETTLDVEQSGALAPGAKMVVYQAPNSDAGFTDAYFQAASENVADTVSTSWGEAEDVIDTAIGTHQETPAFQAATDLAFLELDAQGQSNFVAQGDAGAFDDSDELGSTDLNVDNRATARGPRRRAAHAARPDPALHNGLGPDPARAGLGLGLAVAALQALGGKSEASFASPTPAAGAAVQPGRAMPATSRRTRHHPVPREAVAEPAVPAVRPIAAAVGVIFHPHPATVSGISRAGGACRPVHQADPFTGFKEYFTGFQAIRGDRLGRHQLRGAQLNGAAASHHEASAPGRLWNPLIYQFAAALVPRCTRCRRPARGTPTCSTPAPGPPVEPGDRPGHAGLRRAGPRLPARQ